MIDLYGKKKLILVGFIASLIVCLPDFLIFFQRPATYPQFSQNQPAFVKVDELNYAARIREVQEGNFLPTDVQLYEHKKVPGLRGILPILLAGFLARLFNNIAFPFLFFDAVMPCLTILLIFLFLSRLNISKQFALPGALIIFFYFDPAFLPSLDGQFLKNLLTVAFHLPVIEMERFPSPQFHFPLLILVMLSLLSLEKHRTLAQSMLLGGLLAATVYSYYYYALFCALFLSFIFLFYLWKKDVSMLSCLLTACLTALIGAIPYLVMVGTAANRVPLTDVLERFGVYHGRYIYKFLTLKYGVIAFILYYYVRKGHARRQLRHILLPVTLLTGLLLLNQQLMTGTTLHPMHWHIRLLHPFSIAATIQLVATVANRLKHKGKNLSAKLFRSSITFFAIFIVLVATGRQIKYGLSASGFPEKPIYFGVLKYMSSAHAPAGVVLTLDPDLAKQLLIHTSHDLFLPHFSGTLASNDELTKRIALSAAWYGFDETNFRYFWFNTKRGKEMLKFIFGNLYFFELHRERTQSFDLPPSILRTIKDTPALLIPEGVFAQWRSLLKTFKNKSPAVRYQTYKIDYIITDPSTTSLTNIPSTNILNKVYEDIYYRVYKISFSPVKEDTAI